MLQSFLPADFPDGREDLLPSRTAADVTRLRFRSVVSAHWRHFVGLQEEFAQQSTARYRQEMLEGLSLLGEENARSVQRDLHNLEVRFRHVAEWSGVVEAQRERLRRIRVSRSIFFIAVFGVQR